MALSASGTAETSAASMCAQPGGAALRALHPRERQEARYAFAFSQIVAVLMRDPSFRKLRIAELEWLVVPAVLTGQWKLAHMRSEEIDKVNGERRLGNLAMPVAVALWANVSAEVDTRLAEEFDKPAVLRADEWSSGDRLWLIAVAGEPRAFPRFLKALEETEFKDRVVKVRSRGPDNKVVVTTLADYSVRISV